MAVRDWKKLVPDADGTFAAKATAVARILAQDPRLYGLEKEEVDRLNEFVRAFRVARCLAGRPGTRTKLTIMEKDRRRKELEGPFRDVMRRIRANSKIPWEAKMSVWIFDRKEKAKKADFPQFRPELTFVGVDEESIAGGGSRPLHLLACFDVQQQNRRAKPKGMVRWELFVEHVMPGEPLPQHPSDLAGARPWYLRSFTTNPARVAFPIPSEPRLVVYWARWADAKGNVGKWSAVCQTRVEGWKPTPVLEYQPGEQRRQIAAGRGAGEGYLEEIEKKQLPGQTVTVKTLTREPAALPPPDAA